MADNTEIVSREENLAEFQDDKFGLFGYTNFERVILSGAPKTEFHKIYGTVTPQGVTTYDTAPRCSIFFLQTATIGEVFVRNKNDGGGKVWGKVTVVDEP